ncbi:hypothetical protein EKO04_008238 [Ascochyta lentis]|uniref:Wax synthase domain-containing protein n=1 Tax=Ascochyta lentis TaxID=205686 RepID=A0A8H7IVG7_9PLEO|nr:hypothetical protein EKO04_008238 [Ascochyta lentis]
MHFSIDELKGAYFELITTIVPGPASWSYFVPRLLLPLGLLVPPSTLSHGHLCAVILPISLVATMHAWLVLGGNDVLSTDSLYMTLFLYAFKDPRRDFRRVIRAGPDEAPQANDFLDESKGSERIVESKPILLEAYPENFKGRLAWAMQLPQSRPLHDWIIGNAGHDRRVLLPFQHPTRTKFIIDILLRLSPVLSIFLPLSKQLAEDDPYFSDPTFSIFGPYSQGSSRSSRRRTVVLLRTMLPAVVLRPLTMAMYLYSLLLGLFLPPMLLPVLLNAVGLVPDKWSPHTRRPRFGPFSAIMNYGVRGLWGQWWHQQMRHVVSEPGRWFAAKLGLGDKGWQKAVKYMLICISAFMLSGITHAGMVPPKPRFASIDVNELRLRLASFFWIQPLGIAIELFILEPALHSLPNVMQRMQAVLRTIWTVVFMCFACTFLVVPFGQLGYWNIIPSNLTPYLL